MLQLQLIEPRRDLLRNRDRTRSSKRAVIHAGAGDYVADQANVCCRQPIVAQNPVNLWQIRLMDVRQNNVLLVADAKLVVTKAFSDVGEHAHLLARRIARGRAVERSICASSA